MPQAPAGALNAVDRCAGRAPTTDGFLPHRWPVRQVASASFGEGGLIRQAGGGRSASSVASSARRPGCGASGPTWWWGIRTATRDPGAGGGLADAYTVHESMNRTACWAGVNRIFAPPTASTSWPAEHGPRSPFPCPRGSEGRAQPQRPVARRGAWNVRPRPTMPPRRLADESWLVFRRAARARASIRRCGAGRRCACCSRGSGGPALRSRMQARPEAFDRSWPPMPPLACAPRSSRSFRRHLPRRLSEAQSW